MIDAARSSSSLRSGLAASSSLTAAVSRAARSCRLRSVISTTIAPNSAGVSSEPTTG